MRLAPLLAALALTCAALPAMALTDTAATPSRAARKAPAKAVRTAAAPAAATRADYATRDDVRAFVREMSERHGFGEEDLLKAWRSLISRTNARTSSRVA